MNTMQQELEIRGYSKETMKSYEFHNRAFLKLIKKSPRDVTRNDIKDYIRMLLKKGYERATINLVISSLRFYYRKILCRNFQIERLRSEKKLYPVLSLNEVERLFGSAKNHKHKMILKFLYYSGVRLSELINIKAGDVDFERSQIHIRSGKGRKDRLITINPGFEDELKNYVSKIRNEDYIFSTTNGKYSKRSIQKICKTYAIKAGIAKNMTPHTLRRTFATHLIENNIHIYQVTKLMGHANVNTTERYISYAKIPLTSHL